MGLRQERRLGRGGTGSCESWCLLTSRPPIPHLPLRGDDTPPCPTRPRPSPSVPVSRGGRDPEVGRGEEEPGPGTVPSPTALRTGPGPHGRNDRRSPSPLGLTRVSPGLLSQPVPLALTDLRTPLSGTREGPPSRVDTNPAVLPQGTGGRPTTPSAHRVLLVLLPGGAGPGGRTGTSGPWVGEGCPSVA